MPDDSAVKMSGKIVDELFPDDSGYVWRNLVRPVKVESVASHIRPLVEAAQQVMSGLDRYCDYPDHQNPYEGGDCPHEFIGLDKCEALRKALENL